MTPTEAMADVLANYDIRGYGTDPHGEWLTPDDAAAAILAGLDGWTLVKTRDLDDLREGIARLREIEEAARLVSQWHGAVESGPIDELEAELHELYVLTHPSRAALAPEAKAVCGGMPWPARCRYCDLVTEDPDAHFWPPGADEEVLPESYRCAASPSRLHEPASLLDLEGARLIGEAALAGEADDA